MPSDALFRKLFLAILLAVVAVTYGFPCRCMPSVLARAAVKATPGPWRRLGLRKYARACSWEAPEITLPGTKDVFLVDMHLTMETA